MVFKFWNFASKSEQTCLKSLTAHLGTAVTKLVKMFVWFEQIYTRHTLFTACICCTHAKYRILPCEKQWLCNAWETVSSLKSYFVLLVDRQKVQNPGVQIVLCVWSVEDCQWPRDIVLVEHAENCYRWRCKIRTYFTLALSYHRFDRLAAFESLILSDWQHNRNYIMYCLLWG